MTKILAIVFICILFLKSTAQNQTVDSLKKLLAGTTKPIERFTLINKIIEAADAAAVGFDDSSYGMQLYAIAQQLRSDSLLAISLNFIGNDFRNRGDISTALEYFFKGIPLAEKAKDKRRISSLYIDISKCYRDLGNPVESFKYVKYAGDNLPDKSDAMYDYMAQQFYWRMASSFLMLKQPDSALSYTYQLEQVNRRVKEPNFIVHALTLSGRAYAQLKDYEMAELYFKKAERLSDSVGTTLLQMSFLNPYIPYLLSTSRYAEAKQYAIKYFKIENESGNDFGKLEAAGYLNRVYNSLHQTDSAYYYLSMWSALKDSIFNQDNLSKIQTLAFNEQIRKIDEQAKQAAAEEERKQSLQYALIALGIIVLLTMYLLLSRSFITSTKLIKFIGVVALLIIFEFLYLLLHPFLHRITHHSPLLMLLSLVCIAALLVPLHHKLEHWAITKLIEKNKINRLAAAKKTIEKLERKS